MPHLILELALWILLAFFIGCIVGCLLRKGFRRPAAETVATPPESAPAVKTARPKPPRKAPGRSK